MRRQRSSRIQPVGYTAWSAEAGRTGWRVIEGALVLPEVFGCLADGSVVAPIALTRRNLPASDIRRFARPLRTGRGACRLLDIAMVLEGVPRSEEAAANGMDAHTPRDCVLRYNADGVPGPRNRGGRGRRPALSAEQLAALKVAVIAGPDAARDGVARWRCAELQGWLRSNSGSGTCTFQDNRNDSATWSNPYPCICDIAISAAIGVTGAARRAAIRLCVVG